MQLFTHFNTILYCLSFLVFSYVGNTKNQESQLLFVITWPFCIKLGNQFKVKLFCNQFSFFNQKFLFIHYFFAHARQQFDLKSVYFKCSLQQNYPYNLIQSQQINLQNQQFLQHLDKLFKKAPEKQLYLSLLLLLKEYFKAYQYSIKKKHKESMIQFSRYKISKQIILNELRNQMLTNNSIQLNTVLIDSLISVETQSIEFSEKLLECCQKKIEFHQICLSYEKKNEISKKADDIVELFENTIQKIEYQYKNYPLIRYQRCLSFGYAELCNDILLAIRIMNQSSFPDEFIYTKILTLNEQFISQKTVYLTSNLENQNVIKLSSNFHERIYSNVQNILQMIPNGIQEHHQQMIQEFIKTGKSIFFQKATQTLYQDFQLIKPMILMNDIVIQDSSFVAISIMTFPDQEYIIIVVDNNQKVRSLSQGFLDQINLDFENANLILGVDISLIIPKFSLISQISTPQYIEIKLPNFSQLQAELNQNCKSNNEKQHSRILDDFWQDHQRMNTFISLCTIESSKYNYHKIYFSYVKSLNKTIYYPNSLRTFQCLSNNCFDEIEEQVNIAIPYDQLELEQKLDMLNTARYEQTQTLIKYDDSRTDRIKRIVQSTQKIEENSIEGQMNQIAQSHSLQDEKIKSNYEMKHFQKYSLFEKIRGKNNLVKAEKMLIIILVLNQLLFFMQILLSLIDCINLFQQNLNKLELLKIKYDLFQPVETFIVTRYTIINYNNQFAAKQITKSQLDFYLKFPNSNLNLGFDDVYQNQEIILNRLELQEFLSQFYEIYIYSKTDIGEMYNITMRQALSILINYQYTFKAAYVFDGRTVTDSPYIFYSYRNLLTLYYSFDQLSHNLYLHTLLTIQEDFQKESSLFYPFLILFILFLGIEIYYDVRNNKILIKFVFLILYTPSVFILKEISRLSIYLESYVKNPEKLFRFKFNIEEKEKELKSYKELNQNFIQQKRPYITRIQYIKKSHLIVLFLQLAFIISFGIIKENFITSYLTRYQNTCQFSLEVSHLGTNIPTIYAMREVLYYRWRYPFYKEKQLLLILEQIKDCLKQVHNITNDMSQLTMNDYLLSESFGEYIDKLYQTSLCEQLPGDLQERSIQLCQTTLGGSLRKGLYSALVYIYTSVQNEMQINEFYNKTENTVNELEGVFMVSQIIKQMNTKLWSDVVKSTDQIQQIISIVSFLYLLFVIMNLIIIFFLINRKLERQYYLSKRYLYLVPQAILFGNDAFERLAKGLLQLN
ncbi:unnamed protein product [Paramecium sonneborni]|uniref:Transmembrane protein n=1 Tax=Paramecium sonneborni TaxID=65129 RepID=A0A8S1QVW7_9CILI|nr:unnamed protein product [Paramecium sonneborni]